MHVHKPARFRLSSAWRAALWRWRFLLGAVAIAAGFLAWAQISTHADDVRALALTRDLPAGARLTEADVEYIRIPRGLTSTITDVSEAAGRVLVVPASNGTLLSTSFVAEDSLASVAPEGTIVVTVALSDPGSVALATVGAEVILVGDTPSSSGEILTEHAHVIDVLHGDQSFLGTEAEITYALFAIPTADASVVMASSALSPLRVALESSE